MPQEPPPLSLMKMLCGKWLTQAIGVAAELRLADHLAAGPRSAAELAAATGANEDGVFRLLRGLASVGVFAEGEPRKFALTPMAACLQSDVPGSLAAVARFFAHEVTWRPWGEALHSVRTGEQAFSKVFGKPVFEWAPEHPEATQVFHEAMTSISTMDSMAVAAGYDFSGIDTLVDIGGGHGLLLATVLEQHPRMKGILFDQPHATEGAKQLLASRGLTGRCEVVAGDFFAQVPSGGDAYMMKHILHDWDDALSTKILESCHQAMGPAAKLLVVDAVIAPGNDPDFGKLLDLEMLVMTTGGRERTQADFAALFDRAGFRLTRVVPTMAPASVVEGVRA